MKLNYQKQDEILTGGYLKMIFKEYFQDGKLYNTYTQINLKTVGWELLKKKLK